MTCSLATLVLVLSVCLSYALAYSTSRPSINRIGGAHFFAASSASLLSAPTVTPPVALVDVMAHLGDFSSDPQTPGDYEEMKKRAQYNLNLGHALEVLRRQLPMVFAVTDLDFSIFAATISVIDQRQNKAVMPKSIYTAAVKSLRMASALSSMYPSMNVKKIEYIDNCRTIQCLVDVVLPDAVRVDGQAVWEGMFYFGVNDEGLIDSHVFDRKISNFRPAPLNIKAMPWLRSTPSWSSDLIGEPAFGRAGLVYQSSTGDVEVVV